MSVSQKTFLLLLFITVLELEPRAFYMGENSTPQLLRFQPLPFSLSLWVLEVVRSCSDPHCVSNGQNCRKLTLASLLILLSSKLSDL